MKEQGKAVAAGFGRFGRIHEEGLLTLNVSPEGFAFPPSVSGVRFFWGKKGQGKPSVQVLSLNPTEKRLRCTYAANAAPGAPSEVRFSLLYPGLSATFAKRLHLRAEDGSGKPFAFRTEFLPPLANGLTPIRLTGTGIPPLLLLVRRSGTAPAPKTAPELILDNAAPLGAVRVVTPWGIVKSARDEAAWKDEVERWALWDVPERTASTAKLTTDGKSVTFTETFRGGFAPLPPVLTFAQAQGYPVRIEGTVIKTPVMTLWGPLCLVRGSTVRYTLPLPSTEERGYLRPEKPDTKRVNLLNEMVGHLGGDWATNGVDLAYAGMANAQMAAPYLSRAQQAQVATAWKTYLPKAFNLTKPGWHRETEPLTGQPYLWTYKIDGPGGYRYDLEWGNALTLYGMYKYAQYTGDWAFVRRNWDKAGRIFRYMDLGDDWAWMTVVNADHGFSTGTGDPMCAYYAGTVACLKMARTLDDRQAEARYAARMARVAVPMVARFWYTDFARRYGLIGSKSVALGFNEREGYTRSTTAESPWWLSTLLSGDGALPEIAVLYRDFGQKAVADFEKRYAAAYPRWFDGKYTYPYAATYGGNSVYVAYPHVYVRSVALGESVPSLWQYAEAIAPNRNNAWIGPNVLAELFGREMPLMLTAWEPAAYRDGVVSADGKQITLDFQMREAGKWRMTARLKPGVAVREVTLDGKKVSAKKQGNTLEIEARRPAGPFRVGLVLR
ncbi:MAG: hypothetical protein OHK0029_21580 [Armatimonadaceae bacterium]